MEYELCKERAVQFGNVEIHQLIGNAQMALDDQRPYLSSVTCGWYIFHKK